MQAFAPHFRSSPTKAPAWLHGSQENTLQPSLVPAPGSHVTHNWSLPQLKNSFILPHVPVLPRRAPAARLSVSHTPFIWDVLKDSLGKLRTHMTLPNSLREATFTKCLHSMPHTLQQSPNTKYALASSHTWKKVTMGNLPPSEEAG